MTIGTDVLPTSVRRTLIGAGLVALVASLTGLVVGWLVVGSVSADLADTVGLSRSALLAIEETLVVIETFGADVDDGLIAAADSIGAASAAADTAAGRLEDVADFLEGDLQADIEALRGSMPAAIQAAGAIDDTLRALSFFGVDYDPDEPFDVSLMAVEAALADLPSQLSAQAGTIRDLVPSSRQFATDAATLAGSLSSLSLNLASTQEVIASYRDTLDQAQEVVDDTGSSLADNTSLLRLLILTMSLAGVAVSIALIVLGRRIAVTTVEPSEESGNPSFDS